MILPRACTPRGQRGPTTVKETQFNPMAHIQGHSSASVSTPAPAPATRTTAPAAAAASLGVGGGVMVRCYHHSLSLSRSLARSLARALFLSLTTTIICKRTHSAREVTAHCCHHSYHHCQTPTAPRHPPSVPQPTPTAPPLSCSAAFPRRHPQGGGRSP